MADLTFASYLQGPLGEAIRQTDNMSLLPPPAFSPAITLTTTLPHLDAGSVKGPDMRLLGPGDVAGLAPGTVIRTDPPPSALDVEGNYLAVAEVVPAELPWVLTPAKAAAGRLRPWFVLVVLEAATAPVRPGKPLPTIEAEIAQLPDLRDSWGWAHVQRSTGAGELPGGGQASAATLARLVCPRRLSKPTTYRACLVPAFRSGVAAGLGDPKASEVPNDLAWKVEDAGTVLLPVYHEWTFTVGASGDFETLVSRLPARRHRRPASGVGAAGRRPCALAGRRSTEPRHPVGRRAGRAGPVRGATRTRTTGVGGRARHDRRTPPGPARRPGAATARGDRRRHHRHPRPAAVRRPPRQPGPGRGRSGVAGPVEHVDRQPHCRRPRGRVRAREPREPDGQGLAAGGRDPRGQPAPCGGRAHQRGGRHDARSTRGVDGAGRVACVRGSRECADPDLADDDAGDGDADEPDDRRHRDYGLRPSGAPRSQARPAHRRLGAEHHSQSPQR